MPNRKQETILAIDPGHRDLGFAILRGRNLIDAGVRTCRFMPEERRRAAVLDLVRAWIRTQQPTVLVLEATHPTGRDPFQSLDRLCQGIVRLAETTGLPVARYPAQTVRKDLLGNGWAKKRDVAVAVAAQYPALGVFVVQNRRWKERYFQNMFDAVALALYHAGRTSFHPHLPSRSRRFG
jgi:Holliday junction resolvasome RuvABC endonuclease subunit